MGQFAPSKGIASVARRTDMICGRSGGTRMLGVIVGDGEA